MKELTNSNALEVILSFDQQLAAFSIDLAHISECSAAARGQNDAQTQSANQEKDHYCKDK